jgi:hypothetical protein
LGQVLEGLLPGLLQMLAVLGISTVVGAGAGAAIGFFFGGVGAAPGAVVGGELGLEVGTAILTWMGLGFLAVAIGQGLGELTTVLMGAIRRAWHAAEHGHQQFEIDRAAQDLARAVGILIRLILQGILAYVLKKGAVSSSSAAISTSQSILKGGTRVAADESLAEVSALLKKSKLPDGFVVWIEKNWEDLKRNPKLASKKVDSNSSSQPSSSPASPSELKAMRERRGRDDVMENSANESKPVAEKTNHEKAAFGERTAHDRMTEKGYEPVGNTDGNYQPGKQGIDGVYKNPSPPPDYIITEVKYGSAQLDKDLADGTNQMDDKWVKDRLVDKVGRAEAVNVTDAMKNGSVEKLLIRVGEDGSTAATKIDANGSPIRGMAGKVAGF